jgi:phage-related protein
VVRWLVGVKVVVALEVAVHEGHKRGVTAHQLDQARYIVLRQFQRRTKEVIPLALRRAAMRRTITVSEYAQ